MPHNLILLENHTDKSSYDFLYKNSKELFELGYNTIFFELYEKYEPSIVMANIKKIISTCDSKNNPYEPSSMLDCKSMIRTYENFNDLGAICRFIDPESESVALEFENKLTKALLENDTIKFEEFKKERILATKHRDEAMSETILKTTSSLQERGGIIFVTGFEHHELIKKLESQNLDRKSFRYAILHGQKINNPRVYEFGKDTWDKLNDKNFRAEFYGVDSVQYLNPNELSFEMIVSTLQLTDTEPCIENSPSMIKEFKEYTQLPFNFGVDKQNIVTATLDVSKAEEPKTISKINELFSGLRFFSQRSANNKNNQQICIPGVNLPEQLSCITPKIL